MRVGDLWTGLALLAFGLAVLLRARTFPTMAGMDYGPGLFPSIAAAGLMASGGVIALRGWRGRAGTPSEAPSGTASGAAPTALGLRVAGVPLVVAFFGLALPRLGFHLTAAASLLALFLLFGLGPLRATAFAVIAAVAIHAVFYTLLRVPLPWGVLTPIAW